MQSRPSRIKIAIVTVLLSVIVLRLVELQIDEGETRFADNSLITLNYFGGFLGLDCAADAPLDEPVVDRYFFGSTTVDKVVGAWLLSPGTAFGFAASCRQGRLSDGFLKLQNQTVFLTTIVVSALIVRFLVGSWIVALLLGVWLMYDDRTLLRVAEMGVDGPLAALCCVWFAGAVHHLRTAASVSAGILALASLVGALYDSVFWLWPLASLAVLFLAVRGRRVTSVGARALPENGAGGGSMFVTLDVPFSDWLLGHGQRRRFAAGLLAVSAGALALAMGIYHYGIANISGGRIPDFARLVDFPLESAWFLGWVGGMAGNVSLPGGIAFGLISVSAFGRLEGKSAHREVARIFLGVFCVSCLGCLIADWVDMAIAQTHLGPEVAAYLPLSAYGRVADWMEPTILALGLSTALHWVRAMRARRRRAAVI